MVLHCFSIRPVRLISFFHIFLLHLPYLIRQIRFANFVFLFQLTVFSPSSLLCPPFFCTFRVTHGLFFTIPTSLGIVSSITSFRLFFNKFHLSFTLASFVLLSRSFALIFNLTRS